MIEPDSHAAFPPTRWSMVLAVRQGGDENRGARALEDLCKIYWQPLYGYARRKGMPPHDAADAVQGFFVELLTENFFAKADEGAGRLRSFLLGAFQRYQRDQWRKASAARRGSGAAQISIDAEQSEKAFEMEDPNAISPEREFERRCALALIETALRKLEGEYAATGRGRMFKAFRPLLSPGSPDESSGHEEISSNLGLTPEASRAALSRMRKRFRELLRDAVADTLAAPTSAAIDEEIQALRAALTSGS